MALSQKVNHPTVTNSIWSITLESICNKVFSSHNDCANDPKNLLLSYGFGCKRCMMTLIRYLAVENWSRINKSLYNLSDPSTSTVTTPYPNGTLIVTQYADKL